MAISEETREKKAHWKRVHVLRMRSYRLIWYYKNRKIVNLSFSKPSSIEPDAADIYYAEHNPEG